jgi:hypothetical protein
MPRKNKFVTRFFIALLQVRMTGLKKFLLKTKEKFFNAKLDFSLELEIIEKSFGKGLFCCGFYNSFN